MLRDFFLGFIKIHVLHHAAQEPIYGVAMIAELARHGYDLSPGTLYPLLHSLEEQGYLARNRSGRRGSRAQVLCDHRRRTCCAARGEA